VTIRAHTEVTALSGGSSLQRITLIDNSTGDISEHLCAGLFCFIGARPETEWLRGVALDRAGFIRTDAQLDPEELGATWAALGRTPLPYETSMPTVFAAGDVRLTFSETRGIGRRRGRKRGAVHPHRAGTTYLNCHHRHRRSAHANCSRPHHIWCQPPVQDSVKCQAMGVKVIGTHV
jgi:hypothetical protein